MKRILFLFFSCFSICVSSQDWVESINISGGLPPSKYNSGLTEEAAANLRNNFSALMKIRGVAYNFDDIVLEGKGFNGSVYLFDNWNNNAPITIDNKSYKIPNLNYNIEKNAFAFKYKDSIFSFKEAVISKAFLGGRKFKTINVNGVNEIYEVIFSNSKLECLKKYSLRLITPSPNPMVNRSKATIKRMFKYYLFKEGADMVPFKLKKSSFFNDAGFQMHKKEIMNFVKSNNLSFRKEKDVARIFAYASKL